MNPRARLEREFDATALGERQVPGLPDPVAQLAPCDEEQLATLFALASENDWKLLPVGCGTKLGWSRYPAHVDVAVATHRLAGVSSYEPADGTVAARAGTTMAQLAAALLAGGHDLAPDVPAPGEATLGGVLAAAQSGCDRLGRGSIRDLVLGMRVLLADGQIARTGGQLVKNVTGYDLHRLYTGSHGSLCLILEAALRLPPRAPFEARVSVLTNGASPTQVARAIAAARGLAALPIRPRSVTLQAAIGPQTSVELAVHLTGEERALRWEHDQVREHLARALADGELRSEPPGEQRSPAVAELRDAEAFCATQPTGTREPTPHVACFALPESLSAIAGELVPRLAKACGQTHARLVAHPLVGSLSFALPGASPGANRQLGPLARELRGSEASRQLRVFVRNASPALQRELEPLHPPAPAALALMNRLRRKLDPEQRFAGPRLYAPEPDLAAPKQRDGSPRG